METIEGGVKASCPSGCGSVMGRLLLRAHPRQAALVGFSGCFVCFLGLLPLLCFVAFPGMLLGRSPLWHQVPLLVWLGCLVYFQAMAYCGYVSLMRLHPVKNMSLQCALAAFVWPFAGVVVLPGCVRRRHWSSGMLAATSVLCGGLGLFCGWGLSWVLLWVCAVAFVLSLVLFKGGGGLSLGSFLPLAVMVLYEVGLFVQGHVLSAQEREMRHQVSEAVGRSIEEGDFWRREREGLCVDEEPLKSLLAHTVVVDTFVSDDGAVSALSALRLGHPAFMGDIAALTALPARGTGHRMPPHGLIVELQLPELLAFRHAAMVFAMELRAGAGERGRVLAANGQLENLRDRCLSTATLLARLVGMNIEDLRVAALAYPLAAGTLTAEEWRTLLAREADWETAYRCAIGDEASSLQAMFADGYGLHDVTQGANAVRNIRRFLPQEVSLCAQRDYLFTLRTLRDLCALGTEATDLEERVRRTQDAILQESTANLHVVSGAMLPGIAMFPLRLSASRQRLELVRLAVEVLVHRRLHGTLPSSLEDLPERSGFTVCGQPVRYERGEIQVSQGEGRSVTRTGFRLYLEEAGVESYRSEVQFLVELPKSF